jgi:hypothetical protein
MSPEFNRQLEDLNRQWFDLEGQLKTYETVEGEALSPAVFSLRYAGRLMARCLLVATTEIPTEAQLQDLQESITVTKHYLAMTKYDIVDGVLIHIDRDLSRNLLPKYGRDAIEKAVVNFPRLMSEIAICRQLVIDSRRQPETRDNLYNQMLETHLPHVLSAYQEILDKENDTIIARLVEDELKFRSEKASALFGLFVACYFGLLTVFQIGILKDIWDVMWPLWIPAFILGFYLFYFRVTRPLASAKIRRTWGWLFGAVTFVCVAQFGDLAFPEIIAPIKALLKVPFSH